MSRCDVYLENYSNYYIAGQQIIGNLQCTFNDPKKVTGVKIKFVGKAETSWSESESSYDSFTEKEETRTVWYGAKETYFTKEINLLNGIKIKFKGHASTKWSETHSRYNSTTKKTESHTVWYHGDETYFYSEINLLNNIGETTIPAGVHKYPFAFTLPTGIPSTFQGSNGNVVYTVKGVVNRPFLKFDYEAESPIDVVALLNLNLDPRLRESQHFRKDKTICCFWCKSGPITFELTLPCTGYAIGQSIPIHLQVENLSNVSVENVEFKLTQLIEFHSHSPSHKTRSHHDTIASKLLSGVGAHGERTYDDALAIPATFSAPNLTACSIINISYLLEAEGCLPCPHKNIKGTIPIVIGHVPLSGMNITQSEPLPSYCSLYQETPPAYNPAVCPYPPAVDTTASAPPGGGAGDAAEFTLIGWTDPEKKTKIPPAAEPSAPPPSYDQAMRFKE